MCVYDHFIVSLSYIFKSPMSPYWDDITLVACACALRIIIGAGPPTLRCKNMLALMSFLIGFILISITQLTYITLVYIWFGYMRSLYSRCLLSCGPCWKVIYVYIYLQLWRLIVAWRRNKELKCEFINWCMHIANDKLKSL